MEKPHRMRAQEHERAGVVAEEDEWRRERDKEEEEEKCSGAQVSNDSWVDSAHGGTLEIHSDKWLCFH